MRSAPVTVRLEPGGPWLPATLTLDQAGPPEARAQLHVHGQAGPRGPAQAHWVRVPIAADATVVRAAIDAGFRLLYHSPDQPGAEEADIDLAPPRPASRTPAAVALAGPIPFAGSLNQ